jgi:hypothetical protein
VVAVERRRIQPPVGLDRTAIFAEFDYILSHRTLLPSALDCRSAGCKAAEFSETPQPSGYSVLTVLEPLTRADCPHCQPMAFMLFTLYILQRSSP